MGARMRWGQPPWPAARSNAARLWFIQFYVPFCRGCKRMAEQWDAVAEKFLTSKQVMLGRCGQAGRCKAQLTATTIPAQPARPAVGHRR
jgi:hypothetical protein